MGRGGISSLTWTWLALSFLQQSCAMIIWTAFVEVEYTDPRINNTIGWRCECGIYGSNSALLPASGQAVLPSPDPLACWANTSFQVNQRPWVALIKRGNCTYTEKIKAAQRQNPAAVVIYNIDGTGNETNPMGHYGTGDTVAIMIGNIHGKEISNLIRKGMEVNIKITLGNARGPWSNQLWVYGMSFAFFAVTAVTLGYFSIISIRWLYRSRQLRRQQMHLRIAAKKSIEKLRVRTLKQSDPEIGSDAHSCAVCIDSYKRGDVVTTLPCSHIFHKTCIEPWLLEHQTCPMCKYDILKGEYQEASEESSSPPADVRFYPNTVSATLVDDPEVTSASQHGRARPDVGTTETESARKTQDQVHVDLDTDRHTHVYQNQAFEGETENLDQQECNNETNVV